MAQCKAAHLAFNPSEAEKGWTYYCILEAGHAGVHRDDDGNAWTDARVARSKPVSLPLEGADDGK